MSSDPQGKEQKSKDKPTIPPISIDNSQAPQAPPDEKGEECAAEVESLMERFHLLMQHGGRNAIVHYKPKSNPKFFNTVKVINQHFRKLTEELLMDVLSFRRKSKEKMTVDQKKKMVSIEKRLRFEIERAENFIRKSEIDQIRKSKQPISQTEFGLSFYHIDLIGKIKNFGQAPYEILKAKADTGDWRACYDLEKLCRYGIFVARSPKEAAEWHKKGIESEKSKQSQRLQELTHELRVGRLSPRHERVQTPTEQEDLQSEEKNLNRPKSRISKPHCENHTAALYLHSPDTPHSPERSAAIRNLKAIEKELEDESKKRKLSEAEKAKFKEKLHDALIKIHEAERSDARVEISKLTHDELLARAEAAILEHAIRRVDMFFYLLIAYYNTDVLPGFRKAALIHGPGIDQITDGAHSAIFTQLIDISIFNKDTFKTGDGGRSVYHKISLICGTHFSDSINGVMEVPVDINDLDQYHIEGAKISTPSELRKIALKIMHAVAAGRIDPINGTQHFISYIKSLFSKFKPKFMTPPKENKRSPKTKIKTPDKIREQYFDLTEYGTVRRNWTHEGYVQSLLRLSEDEITLCRRRPERVYEIYAKKFLEIQFEIHNTPSNHIQSLKNDFYDYSLMFPIYDVIAHTEGENGWYTDRDITTLLEHFYGENDNVRYFPPLEVYQDAGAALRQSLSDNQLQEQDRLRSIGGGLPTRILIPINLGNYHWTALSLYFPSADRTRPEISYFDPLGRPIPGEILDAVMRTYTVQKQDILSCPLKMQHDDYNCGPWIITIFQYLVAHNKLPQENFDILKAREAYEDILGTHLLKEYDREIKAKDDSKTHDLSYLSPSPKVRSSAFTPSSSSSLSQTPTFPPSTSPRELFLETKEKKSSDDVPQNGVSTFRQPVFSSPPTSSLTGRSDLKVTPPSVGANPQPSPQQSMVPRSREKGSSVQTQQGASQNSVESLTDFLARVGMKDKTSPGKGNEPRLTTQLSMPLTPQTSPPTTRLLQPMTSTTSTPVPSSLLSSPELVPPSIAGTTISLSVQAPSPMTPIPKGAATAAAQRGFLSNSSGAPQKLNSLLDSEISLQPGQAHFCVANRKTFDNCLYYFVEYLDSTLSRRIRGFRLAVEQSKLKYSYIFSPPINLQEFQFPSKAEPITLKQASAMHVLFQKHHDKPLDPEFFKNDIIAWPKFHKKMLIEAGIIQTVSPATMATPQ